MTTEQRSHIFKQLVGYDIQGRFVLEELIGMGGMAAVFRARQTSVNRHVAIKLIPADDPILVERFEREAGHVCKLRNGHNVTMYDFGHTQDGYVFLAMELLDGETLGERLLKGQLSIETSLKIVDQICQALGEAHEMGIVHRDIKPENIFLVSFEGDNSFVKVLDFGIAKSLDSQAYPSLTGVGRIIGTPRYMSPEQILGDEIDQRSDIYSLGCVLYQLLSGRPPFIANDSATLMKNHARDLPPEFSEVVPDRAIPHHLEGIVRRMMAKSPGDRLQTIGGLRSELAQSAVPTVETPTDTSPKSEPLSRMFVGMIVASLILMFGLVAASMSRLNQTAPVAATDLVQTKILQQPVLAQVLPVSVDDETPLATPPPSEPSKVDSRPIAEFMFPVSNPDPPTKPASKPGPTVSEPDAEARRISAQKTLFNGDNRGAIRECEGVKTPACYRIMGLAYMNLGKTSKSCAMYALANVVPPHCD